MKDAKPIDVFSNQLTRRDTEHYRLIGKVTTGASHSSDLIFECPEDIPEHVYRDLEKTAIQIARTNFMNGKMGILGNYGVKPARIHCFEPSVHSRYSQIKIGDKTMFKPFVEVDATGLAYAVRTDISGKIKGKSFLQVKEELGLLGLGEEVYHEADDTLGNVGISEGFGRLEAQFLDEASLEADEFGFSTSVTSGEHPSSKYISREDGSDK